MQNEATKTTDNVTWLCPDCRTVTVDPADVTALQAAYDALKAENEQLSRILENTRTQRDEAYRERAAAQRWKPVDDGECNLSVTELITVSGRGKWLRCEDLADNLEVGVTLPDDIRLCRKVQP